MNHPQAAGTGLPIDSRRVAALIVHFGRPEPTERLVSALLENSPPGRVVVVANDDTAFTFADQVAVSVVRPGRNSGFAGGVNLGAEFAIREGYEALWILNNDVTIQPAALTELLKALNANDRPDAVGSLISSGSSLWFGGGTFSRLTGRAAHLRIGEPNAMASRTPEVLACDWINGCSLLVRLQSFQRRGPFDEQFFLYKEELEWQVREPPARVRLVNQILVDHEVGGVTGGPAGRITPTFLARNSWLMARQQPLPRRVVWRAVFIFDFVGIPIIRRRWHLLRCHLTGVRNRNTPGEVLVSKLCA